MIPESKLSDLLQLCTEKHIDFVAQAITNADGRTYKINMFNDNGRTEGIGATLAQALTEALQNLFKENYDERKSEAVANPCSEIPAERADIQIVVQSYEAGKKINLIKAIRAATGVGLAEAKDISERPFPIALPLVMKKGLVEFERAAGPVNTPDGNRAVCLWSYFIA